MHVHAGTARQRLTPITRCSRAARRSSPTGNVSSSYPPHPPNTHPLSHHNSCLGAGCLGGLGPLPCHGLVPMLRLPILLTRVMMGVLNVDYGFPGPLGSVWPAHLPGFRPRRPGLLLQRSFGQLQGGSRRRAGSADGWWALHDREPGAGRVHWLRDLAHSAGLRFQTPAALPLLSPHTSLSCSDLLLQRAGGHWHGQQPVGRLPDQLGHDSQPVRRL